MSEQKQPMIICQPQRCGDLALTVTLEDVAEGEVFLHVSIVVRSSDQITGNDLEVAVFTGTEAEESVLEMAEAPNSGAMLPVAQLRSRTAIAQYAFANPNDEVPRRATVSCRGETVSFDLIPVQE